MNTYFEKEQKKELGKLIDELINTYDTKILDKLDSGITKSLYEISVDDGKEILVKRPVLTKLINNHLKNQQIIPDFIGGPNSLTLHWNQDLNKMIYIFGEVHSETEDCDTRFSDARKIGWGPQKLLVEDFFYSLIQTSDVFIDIFLVTKITYLMSRTIFFFLLPTNSYLLRNSSTQSQRRLIARG